MQVAPGTIAVWSDLGCPWSHAVVWRLHDARRRLGLEGRVAFDHHAFPLELFNSEPTPRSRLEAEAVVAAALAPRAGWQPWVGPAHAWPVTMLPPLEAVQAAKMQSLAASEELDRGLRRAFWGESRCISLRHVILEVANECDSVDVGLLANALDHGRARHAVIDDWEIARRGKVRGSAHLFAPDGANAQNPGIGIRWSGDDGETPVIERDDPAAIDDLVRRAAGSHAQSAQDVLFIVHLPPFETLIDAHAPELHRFLVGCVGPTEAEDCLQETFMSALRAYPRLRHGDNLRAWLYTIARRKATDSVRRMTRRPTRELDGVEPIAPPEPEPMDDGIWGTVRGLPTKQRDALVHRFVLDLAYSEIGARMGTSEEAARQNVSAGLRRLRREVAP